MYIKIVYYLQSIFHVNFIIYLLITKINEQNKNYHTDSNIKSEDHLHHDHEGYNFYYL